jgi:large conductance mechanosensitive channel
VDKKDCPYCFSSISIKATRCPQCTAELKKA